MIAAVFRRLIKPYLQIIFGEIQQLKSNSGGGSVGGDKYQIYHERIYALKHPLTKEELVDNSTETVIAYNGWIAMMFETPRDISAVKVKGPKDNQYYTDGLNKATIRITKDLINWIEVAACSGHTTSEPEPHVYQINEVGALGVMIANASNYSSITHFSFE